MILPLPIEEHRRDLSIDDDLREFGELCTPASQAGAVTTLNPDFIARKYADPREASNAAYESVGRAVVEGSKS